VRSPVPQATVLPSGEKATLQTAISAATVFRSSLPVATSQSLRVLSLLADASVFPSGEKATL